MWLSDSKQTLMMGAAVHCVESILQIRWVKNVVVQCSVCTERGTEAITDLSSQAARIAHEGNILFMAALDAINTPPTVTSVSSPDSRPLLPSSDVSSPSHLHSDPHPAAPTRDSAQTSQQLRNELWRLSLEYSTFIVDEVFKPQIMELLSMGGDGFDSRSEPGIIVRALDYVRSVWPSDSNQVLMMGAAVHCVESILQIRWVKNVVVQCSVCTERGPEAITDLSSQAARIAHEGNILFMAALNAMNPPLTATPVPSPDSRPLLTPVPSSDVSRPSNLNSDPHLAAPTRDSAQTSQQLRNELWRLSLEYSKCIVDEVFKPQIIEFLSMGGDRFDSRSGATDLTRGAGQAS